MQRLLASEYKVSAMVSVFEEPCCQCQAFSSCRLAVTHVCKDVVCAAPEAPMCHTVCFFLQKSNQQQPTVIYQRADGANFDSA